MQNDEFKNWLDSFLNFERLPQKNIFWLDTMEFLAREFNNPEGAAPCVHVAGSKGKGSVARMISSILTEAGFKTGLYTSPHLLSFYERVSQNGAFFSPDLYAKCASIMKEKIGSIKKGDFPGGRPVTWFELVTLYAFLCFREAKTDANVFEVGLGGRLDATNIITPKISVINTIELEHTEYLGDTVEKIAAEKAGIIKEGIPVLCAPCTPSVRKVFEEKAAEKNAPIYFADDILNELNFEYEKGCGAKNTPSNAKGNPNNASTIPSASGESVKMRVRFSSKIFSRPLEAKMRLLGSVQAENAFLAAAAVRLAFSEIGEDAIERGLENARLAARFEIIPLKNREAKDRESRNGALLILDGAHTAASIRGTMETFSAIFSGAGFGGAEVGDTDFPNAADGENTAATKHQAERPRRLLFACAADKDVERIAPLFKKAGGEPFFEKITITRLPAAKQSDPKKAFSAFREQGLFCDLEEDYEKAIRGAIDEAKKDGALLLATGSFYLAAAVLELI